jgi:hypothetical protein
VAGPARRLAARALRVCAQWTDELSQWLLRLSLRFDPGPPVLGGAARRPPPWHSAGPPAHWARRVRSDAPGLLAALRPAPAGPSAPAPEPDRAGPGASGRPTAGGEGSSASSRAGADGRSASSRAGADGRSASSRAGDPRWRAWPSQAWPVGEDGTRRVHSGEPHHDESAPNLTAPHARSADEPAVARHGSPPAPAEPGRTGPPTARGVGPVLAGDPRAAQPPYAAGSVPSGAATPDPAPTASGVSASVEPVSPNARPPLPWPGADGRSANSGAGDPPRHRRRRGPGPSVESDRTDRTERPARFGPPTTVPERSGPWPTRPDSVPGPWPESGPRRESGTWPEGGERRESSIWPERPESRTWPGPRTGWPPPDGHGAGSGAVDSGPDSGRRSLWPTLDPEPALRPSDGRWLSLPDESPLWTSWHPDGETAPEEPADDHLARLDREQRRRTWSG